ncbi:MAG: MgtC/SapB family protein [Planctomycetes bacterium]|nr:MgtC/SapB family protein [Planctomycetota bacterium]
MTLNFDLIGVFLAHTLIALALGLVIGIERQLGQHPAGLRTNALVCLGSALFVTMSSTVAGQDNTRIIAQVVSGIGFICGGAILREGITVRGMNTAATLWCTAAIGCLVGIGSWDLALIGTVAIVLAHFLFRPLAHAIDRYTQGKGETELLCEVKIVCLKAQEEKVRALLLERVRAAKLRLQGLALQDGQRADHVEINVHVFALQHTDEAMNDLVASLASQEAVDRVSWGRAH